MMMMDSGRRGVLAVAFLLWSCCWAEAKMTSESSAGKFGSRTRIQSKQNEAEDIPDGDYLHLRPFNLHRDSVSFDSETGKSQEKEEEEKKEEEEEDGSAGPWNPERKRGKKLSFSDFYVSRGKKFSPDVFYVSRGKREDTISNSLSSHRSTTTSDRRPFEGDGQWGSSKHRRPHILERSGEEEILGGGGGRGPTKNQHLIGELRALMKANGPNAHQYK